MVACAPAIRDSCTFQGGHGIKMDQNRSSWSKKIEMIKIL
jgi:hypothetical protein